MLFDRVIFKQRSTNLVGSFLPPLHYQKFLTVFQTGLIKIALFPQQEGNFYWNTYSFDQNFFHTF